MHARRHGPRACFLFADDCGQLHQYRLRFTDDCGIIAAADGACRLAWVAPTGCTPAGAFEAAFELAEAQVSRLWAVEVTQTDQTRLVGIFRLVYSSAVFYTEYTKRRRDDSTAHG
jgi:hypothetical protein